MSVKLERLDGLKRQFTITVPADDLKTAYQKKMNNVARNASIKGFRQGKVPASVVEKKFGRGVLNETAAELIDASFQSGVNEHKVRLMGSPSIQFDHENLKPTEPFQYTATFEIYPEITLKDLTDVEIESLSGDISDDDVNGMLIQLRTQHAEWVAVDRAAKLGDRVQIDFDGTIDGKPLEQGSAKNHWLELGSHSMIPGFEEALIGVKKDDKKTLNIEFPADYHVDALRGKPVEFAITVHDVQEPKLPALDDEFAKKVGIADGLDALKKQVKERMQTELNENAKARTKKHVLDKLMDLNTIEAPEVLVNAEVAHLQEMTRQQLRQYRRDLSEEDVKKFPLARETYLEDAKKRVILGLLLAEVIKTNNIEVDRDRVNARLREMAAQYGDPEQILPIILKTKHIVSDVEAYVLEEQAINILLTKARVLEAKKSYDAIMNAKAV